MLRREGLYSSHVIEWRRARDAGALAGVAARPPTGEAEPGAGRVGAAPPPKRTTRSRAGQDPGRAWISWEKHTRSWSCSPRARSTEPRSTQVIDAGVRRAGRRITVDQAGLRAAGRSRATHYRRPAARRRGRPDRGRGRRRRRAHRGRARAGAGGAERARFVRHVGRRRCWATLLDEGSYRCSMSTMYRIAARGRAGRERRRQATPSGPGEARSWSPPARAQVWSLGHHQAEAARNAASATSCTSCWTSSPATSSGWPVARGRGRGSPRSFIADAIAASRPRPDSVHADRGSSMTSKPVAQLLVDLGVARSPLPARTCRTTTPTPRPQFKTLKYCPGFPDRFGSLADARAFCEAFFDAYNHEHRHSGIGMHTPASVHYGTADEIRAQRAATLDRAYAANPDGSGTATPTAARCPRPPGSTNPARRPSYRRTNRRCLTRLDIFRGWVATRLRGEVVVAIVWSAPGRCAEECLASPGGPAG